MFLLLWVNTKQRDAGREVQERGGGGWATRASTCQNKHGRNFSGRSCSFHKDILFAPAKKEKKREFGAVVRFRSGGEEKFWQRRADYISARVRHTCAKMNYRKNIHMRLQKAATGVMTVLQEDGSARSPSQTTACPGNSAYQAYAMQD